MEQKAKTKRRGFVMTGGGAKGLYEAGVIHAFHLTGMEFDVITGSSIGAMNSLFYAEYLFCKRQLPEEIRRDPLQAVEQMDGLIKAYHHAWLLMPEKHVVDDSAEGPLGKLKDDLLKFNLSMPQVTDLIWWLTDPDKGSIPPPSLWPHLVSLIRELAERLGTSDILRIFKYHRKDFLREALRTYLARFSMDRSLVPAGDDNKLKDIFALPVSPLRAEHLTGEVETRDEPQVELYRLVDPARTMRDYTSQGIEVRLTRANYRTGRLEMSAYVSPQEFACFLDKHAWRINAADPEKIPLGSFRLQIPGNPLALNAAICSGRFPGVFRPYRLEDIYPQTADNELLYRLLNGWLNDPAVETAIKPELEALGTDTTQADGEWAGWRQSQSMREFFPMPGDTYVDGGAIDNTPYTSAIDFVREAVARSEGSKRDVMLELYVIYLGTEPKVDQDLAKDPTIFEVVSRTLAIQGTAKESSEANTLETINTFGKRGEQLGEALEMLLASYENTLQDLDEATKQRVEEELRAHTRARGLRGFIGSRPEGILERLGDWAERTMAEGLPLHVEAVKIYPAEMPLDTLQFTPRLGYRKENAIRMLTSGCYDTLNTLRARLKDQKPEDLDENDQRARLLAQKWMGETWDTADGVVQGDPDPLWRCQRTACVFHAQACRHGASQGPVVP